MLQTGHAAPSFNLPDADMASVKLADYKGRHVVLYFYPRDDTPGCTIEATEFSDMDDDFNKLNTVVLGVSRDDCMSHTQFRDKHGLVVRLLADTEGTVCNKYGVWQEKEKDGVKKMGIVRSTFIIDKDGILRHALYGITPKGHATEVLKLIKAL